MIINYQSYPMRKREYHSTAEVEDVNERIARVLGWRKYWREERVTPEQAWRELESARGMFGAPEHATRSAGTHRTAYWLDNSGYECSLLPWATQLNWAWTLHWIRPEGTTLFALDWLEVNPDDVAWNICETFLKWSKKD